MYNIRLISNIGQKNKEMAKTRVWKDHSVK